MKIYSPPKEVGPVPHVLDGDWQSADAAWTERLRKFAVKHGKGKLKGKIISFGVGDGSAQYMVYTPSSLIHMPLGDAYSFQYVNRLTARDVAEQVKKDEQLDALFS